MLKQLEGSRAVAEAVALCRPEVICAYPISPQTHIVEGLSQLVKTGELAPCEFVNVESEFAAMSVAIGSSAAGARTYTATASQGLLYMVEAVYNASGLGLPIVMTVANRAIGSPINIVRPDSASRTFWPTMPPAPTANAFSITTTRWAFDSAARTSSSGNGRKHFSASAPTATPSSRSSSMTSSIVPRSEPSATTIVSASSQRYVRIRPPEGRPNAASKSSTEFRHPPRPDVVTFDQLNPWYYADAPRTVRPQLEVVRRQSTFDEVTGGLDEETAKFGARRCMSCGNCFACDNCYGVCPDNAVIKLAQPGPYAYEIDLDFCKGCGLCAAECPCGAIEMQPETI